MPTYPLNRDNAWKAWSTGKVKGVNGYFGLIRPDGPIRIQDSSTGRIFDLTVKERTLGNQAIVQGMNSVRLWISGFIGYGSIEPVDWAHIGDEGLKAAPGASGWDSTAMLEEANVSISALAKMITDFLDQCKQLGIGVILTGNYGLYVRDNKAYTPWSAPGSDSREHLGMFWAEVVKKWGNHKALIGIDILNEPVPPAPLGTAVPTPAQWRQDPRGWGTLAQDVVNKVRAAEQAMGSTRPVPIIVETISGGDAPTIRIFDPYTPGVGGSIIQDPADRLVYSFHHYCPLEITHQGVYGDTWVNVGRVYGKTVARGIAGGFGFAYDAIASFGEGWGRAKRLVKDEATLEQFWQDVVNFKKNAAAAGKPVALYLGEFSHVHPDVNQVEPADPKRSYLIDPENGVPVYRVCTGSEQYRHPIFSPEDRTGGWKKQHHSRWVTRFEPFVADGQNKVRLYFDNLDRLLFGRTWFPGFTATELGRLVNNIASGSVGSAMFVDPIPPSPRPDVILEKICQRDPKTGLIIRDKFDRTKVPLVNRFAVGFPVSTKPAEPGDAREDQNALEWDIDKFANTMLMTVVGPEGQIIHNAKVTIKIDEFWVEVNASDIKIPAYLQAVDLDPNLIEGKFPAKAIAVFSSATPNAEMEAGRDQYIADTLAVCRRHGISWSFLDPANNSHGFIGWRASAASMKRLKADCEN